MAKKKTARPEMYYVEDRDLWRKRVTIDGRRKDIYGKTQEEVRAKIKEMEKQVESGLVIDDNTTLIDYAEKWFEVKRAGLKYNSVEMYTVAFNAHIAPFFKTILLKEIRPLNVRQFMAAKAHLSNSAQTKLLLTLRQILDSAVENGLITQNPCKGIKAGGAPVKVKTPLTRTQQYTLAEAVKGTRAELFTLLCLYAGLRREETLGLMWQNVHLDVEYPYIDVRHTVTFEAGRPNHSSDLKSKAAYRSIPIPPILSDALKRAKAEASSLLVLPASNSGAAMSETAFRWVWGAVGGYYRLTDKKDENGKRIKRFVPGVVDFDVTPHLLRHTYITELCVSGMDIKKIQYLAGHEDVQMTLRVYMHAINNTPNELGPTVTKIFPGVQLGVQEG